MQYIDAYKLSKQTASGTPENPDCIKQEVWVSADKTASLTCSWYSSGMVITETTSPNPQIPEYLSSNN